MTSVLALKCDVIIQNGEVCNGYSFNRWIRLFSNWRYHLACAVAAPEFRSIRPEEAFANLLPAGPVGDYGDCCHAVACRKL